MKTLLTTVILGLLVVSPCWSQKYFPHNLIIDSLRFEVVEKAGVLALRLDPGSPLTLTHLQVDSLKLADADLVLFYHSRNVSEKLVLQPSLELRDSAGRKIRNPGMLDPSKSANKASGSLIWPDATELALNLNTTYTLYVRQELLRTIPCGDRPDFTLKQKLPYYGVAAAGLVGVGMGLVFQSQKEDSYDRYKNVWANEGAKAEADVYLTDAQRQEKLTNGFILGGLGVFAISAGLYTWRWIKTRNEQADYDVFCTESPSNPVILPTIGMSSGGAPMLGVQIRLGK